MFQFWDQYSAFEASNTNSNSPLIAVAYVSVFIIEKRIGIINVIEADLDAYDHTTLNAPVPVRSPKLSSVGPDQYLDG